MNVKILCKTFLRWITIGLWVFVPIGICIAFSQHVASNIMPRLVKNFTEEISYSINFNTVTIHVFEPHTSIHIDKIRIFKKDTHKLLFSADNVEARFAIWESIKRRTWVLSSLILTDVQLGKKLIKPGNLNHHVYTGWSSIFLSRHFSQSLKLQIKRLSVEILDKYVKQIVLDNLKIAAQMHQKFWCFTIKGTVSNPLGIGNFSIISRLNKPTSFDLKRLTGVTYLKIYDFKLKNLDQFEFLQPYLKNYFLEQSELQSELWFFFRDSKIQKIYAKVNLENLNTLPHPRKWTGYIYAKRYLNRFKGALFNLSRRDAKKTTIFPAIVYAFDLKAQRLPSELHFDEIKFLHPSIHNSSRLDLKRLPNHQILVKLFTQFQANNISSAYNYIQSFFQRLFIHRSFKILKNSAMTGEASWSGIIQANNQLIKKQFYARTRVKNLRVQYNLGPILTISQGAIDTNLKNYQFSFDSGKISSVQLQNIQANLNLRKKSQLTVSGQVNQQPFILTMDQLNQYKTSHTINALIKGNLNPAHAFSRLNSMPLNLHGNMLYTARLFIDVYKNEWSLSGSSNLLGVGFVLPRLYLKAEDDALPTSWKINYKNNLLTYDMRLGHKIMTLLQFYRVKNRIKFLKGKVNIGEGKADLPKSRGLYVNVNIPHLSWTDGQNFLTKIFNSTQSKTDAMTYHLPKFLKQLRIHITRFNLFSNPINQLHMIVDFLPEKIKTSLNSAELEGQLEFWGGEEITKVIGSFKKVELKKHFSFRVEKKSSEKSPYLTALSRIAFDLDIQDFQYGVLYFDQIKLTANPLAGHLKINRFFGKNSLFSFEAVGDAFTGNKNSTLNLKGKMSAADVGDLLMQWKLTSRLQNGVGEGTFDLTAQHFLMSSQQYAGHMNIRVSNGTIVQLAPRIQSTVKWGEFLNMLDLSTLWEKLFSAPKTPNGLSFNTLSGNISFINKKLATNRLAIDSDIAQIDTTGEIDLEKHHYNIYLQVNPYVTASLPVVLGTIGTPILGGAAFIANKALEPWLSQKMQHNYHLTGSY